MRLAPWKMLFDKYGAESILSADSGRAEREGRVPRKELILKMWLLNLSSCVPEGDVSTTSGSRRGPLKNRRHVKRKRDSSPTCQDVHQEAATCLDQGEFSGQLGSHSVGSSGTVGPTSLPEGAEIPGQPPSECRVCKRAFFINLSLPCTRGHTEERGPFTVTSVTKGSYSLRTCGFISGSTRARSPTAVISAPRGSPTTPRCALTRGPTPRRSLSAASTVTELSATEGISAFTSAPTLGSGPTCAPSATAPFVSWGPSDATRKSIPDDSPRTPPSGPRLFRFKEKI